MLTFRQLQENHTFGVAFAGLEFGPNVFPGIVGRQIFPPVEAQWDYYKSLNITHSREHVLWERLQPDLYGPLDDDYCALLDTQCGYANTRNMALTFDLYNYGGRGIRNPDTGQWDISGGTGRQGRYTLGSPQVPIDAFADFWSKFVQRFGHHPCIAMWDLMNEPTQLDDGNNLIGTMWANAAQAAINAIRAAGDGHLICVEGYHYAPDYFYTKYSMPLLRLTDPLRLLVASAHGYYDDNHSGTYTAPEDANPKFGKSLDFGAANLVDFAENWWGQLPVDHPFVGRHIGEFGAPTTSMLWQEIVRQAVVSMINYGMIGHYYAAWSGFSNQSSYILNTNPQSPEAPVTQPIKTLIAANSGDKATLATVLSLGDANVPSGSLIGKQGANFKAIVTNLSAGSTVSLSGPSATILALVRNDAGSATITGVLPAIAGSLALTIEERLGRLTHITSYAINL